MDYSNDPTLIQGFRKREDAAFNYFRMHFYYVARSIVLNRGGIDSNVPDHFHDCLLTLIKIFDNPDLVMTCKVSTLFNRICSYQWNNKRRKKVNVVQYEEVESELFHDPEDDEALRQSFKEDILWISTKKLGKMCREVLRGYNRGWNVAKIAEKLNRSPNYIMKKKSECHKRLTEIVKNHPDFNKTKV